MHFSVDSPTEGMFKSSQLSLMPPTQGRSSNWMSCSLCFATAFSTKTFPLYRMELLIVLFFVHSISNDRGQERMTKWPLHQHGRAVCCCYSINNYKKKQCKEFNVGFVGIKSVSFHKEPQINLLPGRNPIIILNSQWLIVTSHQIIIWFI